MSEIVVLFCKAMKSENDVDPQANDVEIFDGVIDVRDKFPRCVYRAEKSQSGWACYQHRPLCLARKDGVYSEINVYVNSNYPIEDEEMLDLIVDTLDAQED